MANNSGLLPEMIRLKLLMYASELTIMDYLAKEPPALTDEQCRELEKIDPQAYVSHERLRELVSLAEAGYSSSAVIIAIREAIWAERNKRRVGKTVRR